MQLSSKVTAAYKQVPLIDYLCGRFSYLPRETWLERLAEGRLRHNGAPASAETIVTQGDEIAYDVPPFPQPPANFAYRIIYEDDHLIGINKPPNLRVHGEGRFMMANLLFHLRHRHDPPYPSALLCNRLDADTSGVVVVARDSVTAGAVGDLLAEREVGKRYLALVRGVPAAAHGTIDRPIGKVENPRYARSGRVPRCWVDAPGAKPAVTHFRVLERFAPPQPAGVGERFRSAEYALVELHPVTGRTHQLRVHLAWLGHPVVGDRLYSVTDAEYVHWREHPGDPAFADWLPRHALHCAETRFPHPHRDGEVVMIAPLADDMQAVVDGWRGKESADEHTN